MEKPMEMTIEEMAKEERREYHRKWRSEHKEFVKKHQEDYWKRKAAQRLEEKEAE